MGKENIMNPSSKVRPVANIQPSELSITMVTMFIIFLLVHVRCTQGALHSLHLVSGALETVRVVLQGNLPGIEYFGVAIPDRGSHEIIKIMAVCTLVLGNLIIQSHVKSSEQWISKILEQTENLLPTSRTSHSISLCDVVDEGEIDSFSTLNQRLYINKETKLKEQLTKFKESVNVPVSIIGIK